MTALCGWFGPKGASTDAHATLQRMLNALAKKHPLQAQKNSGNSAIGLGALSERNCRLYSNNGLTVALLGQPCHGKNAVDQTDAAEIFAKEFAAKREGAFASLKGAFTALVIDENRQSISIAVDRMGIHSLSFTITDNTLLFGTGCDTINAHPLAHPEIDPQALYYYLYFHMIPAPGSIYKNYRRLLPGEYLTFSNGNISTSQYWSMHFEENHHASFAELKEEFMSTLRASVKDMSAGISTGCFLSGGTDSSTMAGMLGEATGKPARSYSIGFDEPGYDEMSYARLAAKHFGTDQHEYYVTPADIVEAIPLIARGYDQPFGNSSAVPTYYCAKMAKQDGIEQLIGGDGGDELFGGNERYAKQRVFSLYEKIPRSLRKGFVTPLINNFPGNEQFTLLRKAKSYVQQASVPMPARLETYNLLERIGYENMFSPAFLKLIDTKKPVEHLNVIYHGADAGTQINRMLALDFRVTLADNDLPKVIGACSLAGMDVTFPMLADSVVAFSAKLAPDLKLKGTKLRYFFKEALSDFLPAEIITKQKHGFGLPFGPWIGRHKPLQELVNDSLRALQRRGFIQPAFIDELTSQHLSTHSGYYGTMVWVLAMLEQWLAEHAPHFSLPSEK
ncbi:MAG: asparagine synthase-related protein [Pseudomonadota bacterium]